MECTLSQDGEIQCVDKVRKLDVDAAQIHDGSRKKQVTSCHASDMRL